MAKILGRLLDVALGLVCAGLLFQLARSFVEARADVVPEPAFARDAAPPSEAGNWEAHAVIVTRNLFGSQQVAPPPPAPTEILEATQLPLVLVGTLATADPTSPDAWAAVFDQQTQQHMVLRPQDELPGGAARVERVEPKRLVLFEQGELRELTLDAEVPQLPMGANAQRSNAKAARSRFLTNFARQREASRARRESPPKEQPEIPVASFQRRAEIYQQIAVEPRGEGDEVRGYAIKSVTPGSPFEKAGLQPGEVVVGLNGTALDHPGQRGWMMLELARSKRWDLTVEGADGRQRSIEVQVEE